MASNTPSVDLGSVGRPLEALLARERSVRVGGLFGASLAFLLAGCARPGRPILVITASARDADRLRLDLDTLLADNALPFAAWPPADEHSPPDLDVLLRRMRVLDALRDEDPDGTTVVVTHLDAVLQPVPSPEVLSAATLRVAVGEERSPEVLMEHLASAGYSRVGAVESVGEFAGRGGLLDLWPLGRHAPVRLDYFGDEIESIRSFDAGTQRSGSRHDDVRIFTLPPERVREPDTEEGAALLPDLLPESGVIALIERFELIDAATSLRTKGDPSRRRLVQRLEQLLGERTTLDLSAMPLEGAHILADVGSLDRVRGAAFAPPGERESPEHRATRIADVFRHLKQKADEVVIYRRAPGEEERLTELFEEHQVEIPARYQLGSLSRSFLWRDTRVAHVAYDDLADLPERERRTRPVQQRARPIENFLELEEGGLVVHLSHGIGVYRGLETIEGPDGEGEFLQLEFAEGTLVYVPVARIDVVQRYVGSGRRPRLSKIGGTEWQKRRKKVQDAVEELADDLLEAHAQRLRRTEAPLTSDTHWQQEFEDAFPYEETPDQVSAVRAIKRDLEGDVPMDRLLCGDVGYGKTEVALRAVFKVAAAGRQAAILVPTKILADQHTRVFTQRFAPYPMTVRSLSGLRSAAENRETIEGLKDGTVDVVIGTHRLLSKDVAFKHLGLLVVDEEQRFGVKHKERLKQMRAEVDILSLSATPIPRTLHMALLGIRDISNLTTPPLGRHPIETHVVREEDEVIVESIQRELTRGGQVFFVASRIRELPVLVNKLIEWMPKLRVTYIHGQMEKHTVERRMLRFVRGDADVLLATTIIESGLDIPNANTILIRDADRYGLAELHQLRGRVGRERRRAYAVLLLPRARVIRGEAQERLRALEEYSELGAGFRIAMRDLEIRGAGNLLGPQQSGHIGAVGYDLYCKMLGDAVAKARGDKQARAPLAWLGLDLPGAIPDDWVGHVREKFRLFRRIAGTELATELDELKEELADRFGSVPPEVDRLLVAQAIRIAAGRAGVDRIQPGPKSDPGVILVAGGRALRRLEQRGLPLRRLSSGQSFLPTPKARGTEAILRAALALLLRVQGAAKEAS